MEVEGPRNLAHERTNCIPRISFKQLCLLIPHKISNIFIILIDALIFIYGRMHCFHGIDLPFF